MAQQDLQDGRAQQTGLISMPWPRCSGRDGPVPQGLLKLLLVSQAPLAKLQAYKRRMGWRLPWASAATSDFNVDFGASSTREQVPPGGLPPIVAQNAAAAGTDVRGYLTEAPAVSVFTLQGGVVYQTYATTWRGVEFLMGYYAVLDRAPKGRDEGEAWQTWIRRHDEYVRE